MKKKIVSLLLAIILILPLLSLTPVSADVTVYKLRVANTDVTSANASDILGDGVFRYDNNTKTLYVRGNCTCNNNIIQNRIDGLTIYVEKDCRWNSGEYITVYLDRSMNITGPGKLMIVSKCYYSILARAGAVLTLDNVWLEISNSKYAIFGDQTSEELVINKSYVHTDCDYGIALWGKITFSGGSKITEPVGAYVYDGPNKSIVDKNEHVSGKLTIDTDYSIIIAGKSVTMSNKTDILGNGVFSFDDKNKILTVKGNCESPTDSAIANKLPGLTIYVAKDSNISASIAAITVGADTTITGPGKLTATGIFFTKLCDLTIEDANVISDWEYGIMGSPKGNLIIKNSDVYAKGTGMQAIYNLSSVSLNGCNIVLPEGGRISGGKIVNKSGGDAYEVKIEKDSQSSSAYKRGDCNKDGCIDNKDVVMLFRYVSDPKGSVDTYVYDFNEDGEIDNKDVVALFRYVSSAN